MRILHFEDSSTKYMSIFSVLKSVGVTDITWVHSVEEGFSLITDNHESFDLIISDMHYPVKVRGASDVNAGAILIDTLAQHNIIIPVIIMSSHNYIIKGAYKCIWFADHRNWEDDLRACVRQLSAK